MHWLTNIHAKDLRTRLAALLALLVMAAHAAKADERKPVVIACDWDFAPYEFINSEGKSDGFNTEVLSTIMDALGIPYEFTMKARKQAVASFLAHEADLIVDYRNVYENGTFASSLSILDYYSFMVAHRNDLPNVTTGSELRDKGPVVTTLSNDSIARFILGKSMDGVELLYHSSREALSGISNGDFNYFVGGKETLEWKIKEYNLTNIVLNAIDIPQSEIHIVGYDKQLVDEIDSQFARLQQSGKIDAIRNRWFHPERIESKESPIVGYIIVAIALLSVLFFTVYWFARSRVKAALRRNDLLEAMMHQALSMGQYTVMINNLRQNRVTNHHGHSLPDEGVTTEQMMERIHPADRGAMMNRDKNKDAKRGEAQPFRMRWNEGTKEAPQWINVAGYSYPEFDSHGRPTNIIITSRNVTDTVKKEREEREIGSRYRKIFDSSLLAMSFYGADGHLIDLNENMKKLCGLTDESLAFFWQTSLFDIEVLKGEFLPSTKEPFHVCQHMHYPDIGLDKYVEMKIRPTAGEDGKLLYYIITARDTTSERSMYLEQVRQNKALTAATETNNRYEEEMRTLLGNCNMYVWHTDVKAQTISFSRTLDSEEFTETFEEYVNGMYEEHRQAALQNIKNIWSMKQTFNVVHHFHHTPVGDVPAWYAVSGMPLLENGKVASLFGIVRDVTPLMEAQEKLKEETARAENSAMLKSTFLANMTHEIRTPLNAIVGFSDLLQMVESPDERKDFIRIIRNNCDMLMRLINDIFEASTMDIKPLDIEPTEVDFASEFDVVAHSLAQRVQEPGVEFIIEKPYHSFVTRVDMGRMQQVITNFVTNAVKYTHNGHIRVGYRYEKEANGERKGIYMFCEDTGAGIPKEKQKKVFERFVKLNDFVQGTGLGLSICKSIAERSDGSIGVESEGDGKGSTFWIWVPCPLLKQTT